MDESTFPEMTIVIFQQGSHWVAQGLEYDLTAQAKELRDLPAEFERVLVGHMYICEETGNIPFECLPKAPLRYWKHYAEQTTGLSGTLPSRPARLPRRTMRAPQVRYAVG